MADTLAQAATHPSLSCENCKTRLRLWPEGRGGAFVCDGRCRRGDKILNTGKNRSLNTFYSSIFHLQILSRYNCFLCNLDLCDVCAGREVKKLKRKASSANSLDVPGSRRNSTEAERLLQSSSRRSSHALHPANLPNLRRLSEISQHSTKISSSRKSSKCDERCLSRRSSNIQQEMKDTNAIPTSNAGSSSQTSSSKCMKNTIIHKDRITNLENKESDSLPSKESAVKLKNDSGHSSSKPDTAEIFEVSQKTSNP